MRFTAKWVPFPFTFALLSYMSVSVMAGTRAFWFALFWITRSGYFTAAISRSLPLSCTQKRTKPVCTSSPFSSLDLLLCAFPMGSRW